MEGRTSNNWLKSPPPGGFTYKGKAMSKELMIELTTPILATAKGTGDEELIDFINLDPPTGKIAGLCANIKSAFFNAVSKLPTESPGENSDTSDIKGKDMMQMMYMSGIDMEKVIVTAKAIIKETGLLGGEKVMTQPMIDRMSPDDIEKCLGEYMENFILKSALQEMNAG